MDIIKVSNLNKIYKGSGSKSENGSYAVKDLELNIKEGEMIGFIGPNGAGKSTTLKMLSGIIIPTSGQIEVNGFVPYKRKKDFLKNISIVMGQRNQLEWDLTSRESYEINRVIYDISKEEFNKRLQKLVDMLDVEKFLDVPVMTLSAGERMKMEIIYSLLHNPKVIFLDEPTVGLDIVSQKKLYEFIKEYKKTNNVTMLLTSHYLGDIKNLCERLVIINKGQKIFDDKITELSKVYSDDKVLTLDFTNKAEINEDLLNDLGKVTKVVDSTVEMEVKEDEVQNTILNLREKFGADLYNINISDQPIEEIVCKIFEA